MVLNLNQDIENEIKKNKWNKKEANVFRKSCFEIKKRNSVRDRLKAKLEFRSSSFQEKWDANSNQ